MWQRSQKGILKLGCNSHRNFSCRDEGHWSYDVVTKVTEIKKDCDKGHWGLRCSDNSLILVVGIAYDLVLYF